MSTLQPLTRRLQDYRRFLGTKGPNAPALKKWKKTSLGKAKSIWEAIGF